MKEVNINQVHNGVGNNVVELKISIDVGRLRDIVETESERIRDVFMKLASASSPMSDVELDGSTTSIGAKNIKNELVEYWENFIKKHESKINELRKFFAEEEHSEQIEKISEHLRKIIYTSPLKTDKKDNKLTASVLQHIIEEHTKSFENIEDKDIAELIIFYLYRDCFIGEK